MIKCHKIGYLHEEIVWLDIPMDEVFAVNELYPRNELVCQQQYGFEAESSWAEVEQILQRGAK